MISAYFEINGRDFIIDWPEVDIDLFHAINRVIDKEGKDIPNAIYFSKSDFRKVRSWFNNIAFPPVNHIELWVIKMTLDGFTLTLKVKQDE